MISAKKISEYKKSEPAILSLSEKELSKVTARMPVVLKLIGIDKVGQGETGQDEMEALASLISNSFAMLTPSEITYAFMLYISGDIEVPKEYQHYGQLNLKFIGKVLQSYLTMRAESLKHLPKETIEVGKQLAAKHPFDECMETYIFMLQNLSETGSLQKFGNFDYCFYFLRKIGEISPSPEEYKEHEGYVRIKITEECDTLQSPQERKNYREMFNKDPEAFKTRCRDQFFKRWIEDRLTEHICEDGSLDRESLSKWVAGHIEEITRKNNSGEFNQFRK